MTDEEKQAINRRLLEFCGWKFHADSDAALNPKGHACWDKTIPDLFSETEGAEWREEILKKLLALRCRDLPGVKGAERYPDEIGALHITMDGFGGYYIDIQSHRGPMKQQWARADTYAESFCRATDTMIQALEAQARKGKESE